MKMAEIILVTDRRGEEPCIILGYEYQPLRIVSSDGFVGAVVAPPKSGWNHNQLIARKELMVPSEGAYDAFLGDHWIGSTEV